MRHARICCMVAMTLVAVATTSTVLANDEGHDRWDRHDERMGSHWGDFGERTGERWGDFGERMGDHWGHFGEEFGESFADGDYRSAEDAFFELDWDWVGTLVTEAIETTIDAVDAALDSFDDFQEVVD